MAVSSSRNARSMCAAAMVAIGVSMAVLTFAAPGTALSAESMFDFKGSLGEGRHTRYVPPLVNPLFNETPYITTELRPAYLHYDLPSSFLTGGGTIDVYALEIRIALTERLGFIASKDGYAVLDFDAVLPDERGFANISAGLKYALYSDPQTQSILTIGAEYEPPTGTIKTGGISLQGEGDGFVDLFISGARAWDRFGLQANVGINAALDNDHNSSLIHYSLHADYELFPNFFPIFEINGITTLDKGNRTAANFEGFDLVNFGSTNAGTVITAAAGMRLRFNENVQLGIGYERPITDREDIIDWKFYADLVFTY